MKTIFIALVIFVIVGNLKIQVKAQERVVVADDKSKIALSAKLLKLDSGGLEAEIILENRSKNEIYIASSPMQLSGKKGFYVSIEKSDSSTISLACRVYSDPKSFVYSDDTSVELKRLLPGDTHVEQIIINGPIKETFPPFDDGLGAKRWTISYEQIKKIDVVIGYFDDRSVGDTANRRVKGSAGVCLSSGENTTLLDLQKFVKTEIQVK